MMECSFHPEINRISDKIICEKEKLNPTFMNKFEKLYLDA